MVQRNIYCEDNMFRYVSEHHAQSDEDPLQHLHLENKNVDPTGHPSLLSAQEFLYSSTLNIGDRNYEISFEQNFLEEHTKAFQKQAENFIESSFKFSQEKVRNFKSDQIFSQDLIFENFKCLQQTLSDFDYKFDSKSDVLKQDKLEGFLKFLHDSCPRKLAGELAYLSIYVFDNWKKALEANETYENQSMIASFAQKLANDQIDNFFFSQKIKLLNFKSVEKTKLNSQTLLKIAFREFLNFYYNTIILIVEGYFSNPFTENDEAKRSRGFRLEEEFEQNDNEFSFSSADSIQFGMPKKKMH